MSSLKNIAFLTLSLIINMHCLIGQECQRYEYATEFKIPGLIATHEPTGSLWQGNNLNGLKLNDPELTTNQSALFFGAGLWLAGHDETGQLKVAANTYGPGTDFWPGPILHNGNTTTAMCENFDFIWKMQREVIDAFLDDWEDNDQLDNPIATSILSWPGKENPHSFINNGFGLPAGLDLAPFVDNDGDGIYNPENGDYPNINNAKKAQWWIFNDVGNKHTNSNAHAMQVEIKCLAYTFDEVQFTPPTIFYEYEIINKSDKLLKDAYIGLWLDQNMGCSDKEVVGCISENDLAYFYSKTNIQSGCECPIPMKCNPALLAGVKLLQGFQNDDGENLGMTSFSVYNNANLGFPTVTSNPHTALDFYNYLQGLWKDGTPMTVGGFGYNPNSTEYTKYAFDGRPDNPNDWTSCNDDTPFRRSALMSSGHTTLKPGEKNKFAFAAIVTRGVNDLPCPNIDPLIIAANEATLVYEQNTTAFNAADEKINLSIFPNPANQFINIKLEGDQLIDHVRIVNIAGIEVTTLSNINNNNCRIDLDVTSGIYFLEIITTDNARVIQRIMIASK